MMNVRHVLMRMCDRLMLVNVRMRLGKRIFGAVCMLVMLVMNMHVVVF